MRYLKGIEHRSSTQKVPCMVAFLSLEKLGFFECDDLGAKIGLEVKIARAFVVITIQGL